MFKKSLSIALAVALGLSMSHVDVFADVEGLEPSIEQNEVVSVNTTGTEVENIDSNQNGGGNNTNSI